MRRAAFASVLLLLLAMSIQSCGKKEVSGSKSNTLEKQNAVTELKPRSLEGMYDRISGRDIIDECPTRKRILISQSGAFEDLRKIVYKDSLSRPKLPVYVSTEGFFSVTEKSKGGGFDTVFVLTRFVSMDSTKNCSSK